MFWENLSGRWVDRSRARARSLLSVLSGRIRGVMISYRRSTGARDATRRWLLGWLLLSVPIAGCGRRASSPPPPPVVVGAIQVGVASWYGNPFHGRQTANGEVYDMNAPTAAHRTLPFDTRVRVENLTNGKTTVVRINDRGPFAKGRIIDLSRKAASEIDMIGPGTARVRLRIIGAAEPVRAGSYSVQVGAFRVRRNAEKMQSRLANRFPDVRIEPAGDLFRVRVGRLPGLGEAQQLALRLKRQRGVDDALVVRVE